jgi:predicted neuraminidase
MTRRSLLVSAAVSYPAAAAASPQGQFIYEQAPFPSCHASTIVETAPGSFMASWFGGTAEGKPDVAIWGSHLAPGAASWSAPVELVREEKMPCFNPVLYKTRDGRLCLNYKFGPTPRDWTSANRWSTDGGKTWGPIEYLPAGLLGPIKNKPLVLKDGVILAPTSVESYKAWACWVERSTDNGRTWTKHGPISVPGKPYGIIQPAIVPVGRKLRMFVRSTPAIGRICVADSTDGGRTWTDARPIDLPNPNSGIDATGLRDGRIVLIYNHTAKGRSPINLAVSKDGERWSTPLALESDPGEYSYPAVIQAADGAVHVTYTWKRERIKYVKLNLRDLPESA